MIYKLLKLLLVVYFGLIGFVLVGGYITKLQTKAAKPAMPAMFTSDAISAHNSEDDCWLLISSKVYDVTQFISQHPGGKERIIPNCGQDATQAFKDQDGKAGHSATAQETLKQYYIGDLKK